MSILKKITDRIRLDFAEATTNIAENGKTTLVTVILTFLVMIAVCLAVFFSSVQGAEQVLVPDVTGKSLPEALLEMQRKELYPKLTLHYSEVPGERGTVISQNPKAGSIVKAYRRVNITVSRGVQNEYLENYIGKKVDDVKNELEVLASGESALKIARPVYIKDSSAKGTIIAQYPESGAAIDETPRVQFVVSLGDEDPVIEIPEIQGKSIKAVLEMLDGTQAVFDFTAEEDASAPKEGKVLSCEKEPYERGSNFVRTRAKLALKPTGEKDENIQGIFQAELPDYPFPVSMRLEATSTDGNKTVVAEFNHPGKLVSVPYDVKKGSLLSLYVLGEGLFDAVAE